MEFYEGANPKLVDLNDRIKELVNIALNRVKSPTQTDEEYFGEASESLIKSMREYTDEYIKLKEDFPPFSETFNRFGEFDWEEPFKIQEEIKIANEFPLRYSVFEKLTLHIMYTLTSEIREYIKEELAQPSKTAGLDGPKTEEQKATIRRLIYEGKLELFVDAEANLDVFKREWDGESERDLEKDIDSLFAYELPKIKYDLYPYSACNEEDFVKKCTELAEWRKNKDPFKDTPYYSVFFNDSYIRAFAFRDSPRITAISGLDAVHFKMSQYYIECLENPNFVPTLKSDEYQHIIAVNHGPVRITGECEEKIEAYYQKLRATEGDFTLKPTNLVGELHDIARTFIKHFW